MTANPATSPFATRRLRLLFAAAATTVGMLVTAPSALAVNNDFWENPFNAALNSHPVTLGAALNAEATTQANEPLTPSGPGTCGGSRTMVGTTWYRILGNGGVVSINTAGSDYDTVIAAYSAPTPLISDPLPCNDDASSTTLTSAISFQSVAGSAYLIQVGGCYLCERADTGNLVMNITATDPPGAGVIIVPPIEPPDADLDGIPEDGRDKCPGVKPTVDVDKDGCQDPPKAILARFGYRAQPIGNPRAIRGVRISRPVLTQAPRGARVSVSCFLCRKPGGFRSFSVTTKRAGSEPIGRLSGVRLLRRGKLTLIVTAPQRLGRKIVVTLRNDGPKAVKYSCLAVGSRTQRVPCPSEG